MPTGTAEPIRTPDLQNGAGKEPGSTAMDDAAELAHDRKVAAALFKGAEVDGFNDRGTEPDEPSDDDDLDQGEEPAAEEPDSSGVDLTDAPAQTRKPTQAASQERRELEEVALSLILRDGYFSKAEKDSARKMVASKTDLGLKELVDRRRTAQSNQDRMGNELKRLKDELAALKGAQNGNANPGTPAANAAANPVEALQAHLRNVGDPETADLFGKALEFITSQAGTKGGQSAAEDFSPDAMVAKLQEPLDKLGKTYPRLKTREERLALLEVADRLVAAQAVDPSDGIETALDAACRVRYGEKPRTAQARLLERSELERHGQPDPTSGRAGSERTAMSEEERDRLGFKLLSRGFTPDQVAARLSRAVRHAP